MDFSFRLTEDDWRDAVSIHSRSSLLRLGGQLLFAGIVFLLAVLSKHGPFMSLGFIYMVWSTYAFGKTLLLPRLSAGRQFRGSLTANLNFSVNWSDAGLRYRTQMYDMNTVWGWHRCWAEGKRVLVVYDQLGGWLIIPKRIFDSGQLCALRQALDRYVNRESKTEA